MLNGNEKMPAETVELKIPLPEMGLLMKTMTCADINYSQTEPVSSQREKAVRKTVCAVNTAGLTGSVSIRVSPELAQYILIYKGLSHHKEEVLWAPIVLPLLIGDLKVPQDMEVIRLSFTDQEYQLMKNCMCSVLEQLPAPPSHIEHGLLSIQKALEDMENMREGRHTIAATQLRMKLLLLFRGLCSDTRNSLLDFNESELEAILSTLLPATQAEPADV